MDSARKWTDKELKKMEREIAKIYKQATKDLVEKWTQFMSDVEKELASYETAYQQAKLKGDSKTIAQKKKSLEDAKKDITIKSDYYQNMIKETCAQISNVNQTAISYMNGKTVDVYTNNYNYIPSGVGKAKIKYSLIDESTVRRLIKDGDIKLPYKKLNIPRDERWNTKQLNSSVLQGIIQGESMGDIAKRILPVVDRNKSAAIRNARTMVTGAENHGRLDRYKDLEEKGLVMKKVWIATGDNRTRDWHAELDGVEVDVDEPWTVTIPSKDGDYDDDIMYPGDPDADPANVYNCRCSMKTHILGVLDKETGDVKYFGGD